MKKFFIALMLCFVSIISFSQSYVWVAQKGDLSNGDVVLTDTTGVVHTWNFYMHGSTYFGFDTNTSAKGIQMGKGTEPADSIRFATSFVGVDSVRVNLSTANNAVAYLNGNTQLTNVAADYMLYPENDSIVFVLTQPTTSKALYIKSIAVFSSDIPTAIKNNTVTTRAIKMICNGQIVILKNGVQYNVIGNRIN